MSWLRLLRLPTVFTSLSNILCGYFIAGSLAGQAQLLRPELAFLLWASAGLYLGGMVLNDVFDAPLDALERPDRPIPSGQISSKAALILGIALLVIGLACAHIADWLSSTLTTSVEIALALIVVIVLYDWKLKNTPLSPFGMAACRGLNIMLGASCCGLRPDVWSSPQLLVAGALAVYILGVTTFALFENKPERRGGLWFGLAIVFAGLACAVAIVANQSEVRPLPMATWMVIGLIGIVGINILRRVILAVRSTHPAALPKTVGYMLLQIIFLDAAFTFALTGNARFTACILILTFPATALKRVIPMS